LAKGAYGLTNSAPLVRITPLLPTMHTYACTNALPSCWPTRSPRRHEPRICGALGERPRGCWGRIQRIPPEIRGSVTCATASLDNTALEHVAGGRRGRVGQKGGRTSETPGSVLRDQENVPKPISPPRVHQKRAQMESPEFPSASPFHSAFHQNNIASHPVPAANSGGFIGRLWVVGFDQNTEAPIVYYADLQLPGRRVSTPYLSPLEGNLTILPESPEQPESIIC
jgi:hypothetical protein